MLLKCCTQYTCKLETQQWPLEWKRSVFIPIPKKGSAKECSNYCTIALISHASKVMLKIRQARLQQYVNWELPDVQAGFWKAEELEIAKICWIIEEAREFQKDISFCFIDTLKPLTVWIKTNWKIFKEIGIPDHLICLLRNLYAGQKQRLELNMKQWAGFKLGKECIKAVYCHPVYLTYMQSTSCEMPGWMKPKMESRLPGEISITSDMQMIPLWWQKLKSFLMRVKEESEKTGIKLNIQKTKIMASDPITSWQINGEKMKTVTDFIFLGSKITADDDCSHKIKRYLLLGRQAMTNISSVAQLYLTLWELVDCSVSGFPVLHHLPEFAQTHVHWVGDAIQPSNPLSSPSPLALSLSSIRVFSIELALRIRWLKYWSFIFNISPSNEYTGLVSFNIDWFDLLASKGLSRVFSSTTIWKLQFFRLNLVFGPTLTSVYDCWKNK